MDLFFIYLFSGNRFIDIELVDQSLEWEREKKRWKNDVRSDEKQE